MGRTFDRRGNIQIKPRKNSKSFSKTLLSFNTEDEILKHLNEVLFGRDIQYQTPYFFTHIQAIDPKTNEMIFVITQTVERHDGSISVPPKSLAEALHI